MKERKEKGAPGGDTKEDKGENKAYVKGKNVNHAGFDDIENNSLDNDCHHKKEGRM